MAERIILKGRTETLKPIITQILALHQLIENRDIGEFCGYPIEEMVRGKPQVFKLKLLWYSVPEPPWKPRKTTDRFVRATYNIPFVRRSKIDWLTIKQAMGGNNGYSWGHWRCTANIEHQGLISQMQVHASTKTEARNRLKTLATLSEGEIISLSTTEEEKEEARLTDKKLYKETTKVYPAYFTIVHTEKVITESNRSTLTGKYNKAKFRIPVWTANKPDDTEAIIREALKVRGSSV